MGIRVCVDGWQMQCCGEPFAVGSEVSWRLQDADFEWLQEAFGDGSAPGVDAAEEHHSDVDEQSPVTRGTVASIHAVHCRYAPLI